MFHNFRNSFSDEGLRKFYFFWQNTKYFSTFFVLLKFIVKILIILAIWFEMLIILWERVSFNEGVADHPHHFMTKRKNETGDGIWSKSGTF